MSFATWNNGRAYLGLDFDQYSENIFAVSRTRTESSLSLTT